MPIINQTFYFHHTHSVSWCRAPMDHAQWKFNNDKAALGGMTKNQNHSLFQYYTGFMVLHGTSRYFYFYLFTFCMTQCFTIFNTLSDLLIKMFGLKWLIILHLTRVHSTEKHFVIQSIYTGLLCPAVRCLFYTFMMKNLFDPQIGRRYVYRHKLICPSPL